MSLTGVGALAGSLVVASMRARRRGLLFMTSALVMGLDNPGVRAFDHHLISAPSSLAIGVGQSLRMSLSNVLIQKLHGRPVLRGP